MNCSQAIQYVHSLERFGIKPGLERVSLLCEKLGNPQDKLKFIHVAGTNGKRSVCTVCSRILTESGFRTGLYTSPYVIDFRERIQIDGEMIAPADLARCVDKAKRASEENNITVTEFEFITAAAFLYFSEMHCDYVVLEVGLGGRFDATNIIKNPLVSVITSVSLDHTGVLGDTVAKIAYEKAGIIKPGCPAVTYPKQNPEALEVIESTCRSAGSTLTVPQTDSVEILSESLRGTVFSYLGSEYSLPLAGEHMVYNAVTAIEAVKTILPGAGDETLRAALKKSAMPARLEFFDLKCSVILDGGHNEEGAAALRNFTGKCVTGGKITAVCSIMSDKDYEKYLDTVLPLADRVIATQADVPRALDAHALAECAEKICNDVSEIPDAVSAVKYALDTADDDETVLVCGSFYFAGEVRGYLIERSKKEGKSRD